MIKILLITLSIWFYNIDKIQNQVTSQKRQTDLIHLIKLNGKYPSEVHLLKDNLLSKRLKSLLKDRFLFLKKTWAVETPIKVQNNIFIAWGCQQHNCSNTNFIIVNDFKRDNVSVGIRENETVKIYSEDGISNKEVTNWAKRIN